MYVANCSYVTIGVTTIKVYIHMSSLYIKNCFISCVDFYSHMFVCQFHFIALPTTAPAVAVVPPVNSTSFTVSWTITDPDHNYIVTWTNLHTGMMSSVTVPENTNSYMVTGLNGVDNYNVSVTANNSCGMKARILSLCMVRFCIIYACSYMHT